MFQHYVDVAVNYVQSGSIAISDYLLIIVFLVSILESTPVIGTFTPGTLFLLLFGFATYTNGTNLGLVILVCTLGGVVGDVLAYSIGKYASGWMIRHKKLLKEVHIEQGRGFFSRHGGKSIMLGKFVGPIRPIVPLIAGSIRMGISKFMFWNVAGSFLWAAVYIMLGYFFGNNAESIEGFVSNMSVIVTGAFVIIGYFIYRKKKHARI